jgi:hypothetical protein
MRLPSFATQCEGKVEDSQQQTPALSKGITALALLQMVYRGEVRLSSQQIRAAIEALPFEGPRMSAVAVGYMTGDDFASRWSERSSAAAKRR